MTSVHRNNMPLSFFLLFFLCGSTVKSQATTHNVSSTTMCCATATAKVSEKLGVAAFALSLLALIINFAIILWLVYERHCATLTISNATAKGFPGPEKATRGGLPQTANDGDTYMNYTNTSKAYTNLDPTNITEDTVYASLS